MSLQAFAELRDGPELSGRLQRARAQMQHEAGGEALLDRAVREGLTRKNDVDRALARALEVQKAKQKRMETPNTA